MLIEALRKYKKQLLLALLCLLVILAGYFAYELYQSKHFRVIRTNPTVNNFDNVSPFFKLTFNRTLVGAGIKLTSTPSIIKSYTVSGSTVDVSIETPLKANNKYTITINSIYDTKNEHIYNKKISFVPIYVPSQSIPQDQKKALLKAQVVHPASKANIVFAGIQSLVNYGVTEAQINDLEQALYKFQPTAQTVSIYASTIKVAPHNPESSSTTSTIYFSVAVGPTTYQATINYSSLNNLQLILNNARGSQVFDSGVITS